MTSTGIAQSYRALKHNLQTEVDRKVDTLRNKGIYQAILYAPNSYMEILNDPEKFSNRAFLIWIDKSNLYVQKFVQRWDSTFTKSPLIYKDTILQKYVLLNRDTFFYAEILPYTYKEVYQNVEYYKSAMETLHTNSTSFVFYFKDNSITKFIDHLWLEETSPVFSRNLNFKANQISILNHLKIRCEKVIGRF